MADVEHAKGTTEDRVEAVFEALRGAVAGAGDEIVRDLVLLSFGGVAEFIEGCQAQCASGDHPFREADKAGGGSRERPVLEQLP